MNTSLCIVICSLALIIHVNCDSLVRLQSGFINGTTGTSKNGRLFRKFFSIPYAEPPVGKLRFKEPVAVKNWTGIKDASNPPPKCIQPERFLDLSSRAIGQEDCLYLNVFVPNDLFKPSGKAPVIVGIHGGGFQIGTGTGYHPDYFMDYDVVFVNLNYRLGSLGFLGMNNDQISGNFGMKDQSLALNWVNKNIALFGGDPHNVTLLGESAGSACVHLHMFSPLSKGLFQKAIMQSGSALAPWSHHEEGNAEIISSALAKISGCSHKDNNEVLKCLQSLPAEHIFNMEKSLYIWDTEPDCLFRPMIESKVKDQPFLTQKPSKMSYQTKVPWITGINSGEGIIKVIKLLLNGGSLIKIVNMDKMILLPMMNQYAYTVGQERRDDLTKKIVEYYFGTKDIGVDTALKFVDMVTDSLFLHPFIKTIESSNDRQYAYLYDYVSSSAKSQQRMLNSSVKIGSIAGHADELPLLFRDEKLEATWTLEDKNVSENLVRFWANFAISNDPNGNSRGKVWKPVETGDMEYLHIKSNSLLMKKNLFKERFDFWDSLLTDK